MLESKFISEADYRSNSNDVIKIYSLPKNEYSIYNSYIDYTLANVNNTSDIYTYLDSNMQKELYKIVTNEYKLFNDDKLNCAIIILDNSNYGVKALMGSRASNRLVLNYATDVLLQPGSTIKPILDYAPLLNI